MGGISSLCMQIRRRWQVAFQGQRPQNPSFSPMCDAPPQHPRRFLGYRMAPVWGHVEERPQDERTILDPRVRQNQRASTRPSESRNGAVPVLNPPSVIQDIDIQRSGSPGAPPAAPCLPATPPGLASRLYSVRSRLRRLKRRPDDSPGNSGDPFENFRKSIVAREPARVRFQG